MLISGLNSLAFSAATKALGCPTCFMRKRNCRFRFETSIVSRSTISRSLKPESTSTCAEGEPRLSSQARICQSAANEPRGGRMAHLEKLAADASSAYDQNLAFCNHFLHVFSLAPGCKDLVQVRIAWRTDHGALTPRRIWRVSCKAARRWIFFHEASYGVSLAVGRVMRER